MTPKIAIIGAGPSGLTLARCLHVNGIPSTIFERDPSPHGRSVRGGSLDLHNGTGQQAIRYGELWDEFMKHARYESQDIALSDHKGTKYIDIKGFDFGRPEIDRPALYKLLLDSIPPDYFRWGSKLKSVDEDRTLHFEDGKEPEHGFDLVVGADGVWSKVRPTICHISPFYAGLQGAEMWLYNPDTKFPDLSAVVGEGSHFCSGLGDGKFMAMVRDGNRNIQVYVWMRKSEAWAREVGFDIAGGKARKEMALKEFAQWAPQFRRIIEACDDSVSSRTLYMMHVGTRWLPKSGITLMGDAAHVMSVFAGEGVNVAMVDALELSRAIVANPSNIDKAVAEYERGLFPRAEVHQQASWESLQTRFEPSGNEKLKQHFEHYVEAVKKGVEYDEDASKPSALWRD
ncbi:hypothetical protein OIDMADRAFT_108402 [Oidiodendron maius Zn]|uniref:FAD-binding domain-containing protein n=1 Tax=Oidiodendron maius (strain Zn) TaxID=913774 RepID=A0A0C3I3P7_OIDMZ|nr:hypothetical protein OIDMADRAFT_108402 [Oidiodendron maius Zn]